MTKMIMAIITLWIFIFNFQQKDVSVVVGKFVAFDKLQGLTNPREPRQQFIVEVHDSASLARSELLRMVYFAPTTSLRGGAKFLGDETLSYSNTWKLRIHQPRTDNERSACSDVDNFLRTADGTVDENEKHEPLLRYRSTQSKADIKFDEVSAMPCFILDSLNQE